MESDVFGVVMIGVMFTLLYRRIQENDDDENESEELENSEDDEQGNFFCRL